MLDRPSSLDQPAAGILRWDCPDRHSRDRIACRCLQCSGLPIADLVYEATHRAVDRAEQKTLRRGIGQPADNGDVLQRRKQRAEPLGILDHAQSVAVPRESFGQGRRPLAAADDQKSGHGGGSYGRSAKGRRDLTGRGVLVEETGTSNRRTRIAVRGVAGEVG
jgi:hypothetical protein